MEMDREKCHGEHGRGSHWQLFSCHVVFVLNEERTSGSSGNHSNNGNSPVECTPFEVEAMS